MKIDPGDRTLYRSLLSAPDLVRFQVRVRETDVLVLAESDMREVVLDLVLTHRDRLERHIGAHPEFSSALAPVEVADTAPRVARIMAEAAGAAGVGPMAAVAGAICEVVAEDLGGRSRNLIIENGGDVYLASTRERIVGIYSGESRVAVGLRVRAERTPLGICTSSGRIGHSLSFGDAAAATVVAGSCALADAAATAVGNVVRGADGLRRGLRAARRIPGVRGAVVIRDGELGAWGDVELTEFSDAP